MYIKRLSDVEAKIKDQSYFLLGPRQTGKSTFIKKQISYSYYYNLLDYEIFLKLSNSPDSLTEEITEKECVVIIDEIQKLPILLDTVQNLIDQKNIRFLLTGSSSRKLKHQGVNLLGGRAHKSSFFPFSTVELKKYFEIDKAINIGLLPSVYFSTNPQERLEAYVGLYVQEEIYQEALVRNISAFSRFLEIAALSNSQIINFSNIANDAKVPRTTVQEYFQILYDTHLAYELKSWTLGKKRKNLQTSKFYFFDTGVLHALQKRGKINSGTSEFGEYFETYIHHELRYFAQLNGNLSLHYWRSTSGFEVDFILNEKIAIEVKSKKTVSSRDLKGLKAISEEGTIEQFYLLSLDPSRKVIDGVNFLYFLDFLRLLWEKQIDGTSVEKWV